MFLALTADDHFWDKSQKILFLSQGCLLQDARRTRWQDLDFEVLPNLWHDPVRLKSAIEHVDACAEKMLDRLGRYISDLYQTSYHEDHWRIIVYPWLQRYIHIVFDRYSHIRFAFEKYSDLTTRIMGRENFVPTYDLAHHMGIANDDPYNFQICSSIISILNGSAPTTGDASHKISQYGARLQRDRLQINDSVLLYKIHHRHESMLEQLEHRLGDALQRYPEAHFNRNQLPKLNPTFDEARLGLSGISADDVFEQVLVNTLPQNFPTLYLEGYRGGIDAIYRLFPILPSLIVSSAHGWYSQEVFKFLAAVTKTHGGRIASMQAGGSNGIYHFFAQQAHEERISDREFVWGWAKQNDAKKRNVPCFYTSKILVNSSKIKNDDNGLDVLFLQAGPFERYLRWLDSTPYGGGSGEPYIAWQKRFFETLDRPIRAKTFYREKIQRNDGQNFVGRIAENFPELKFEDTLTIAAPDRILDPKVRLIVADHCSTGYLESFAANKPTVLFWNPDLWLTNPSVSKFFDDMRNVNILHDSPESAAHWIEQVYESPLEWWRSDETQRVRREVVNRFGWGTVDWLEHWRETILSELKLATDGSDALITDLPI